MLTFREFLLVCEKKSVEPPNAVPGTYSEKDGVTRYTLKPYEGPSGPIGSAKKVNKMLDKQGGIGGKSMKKHVKAIQKIKEDLEQRRQQLRQRQIDQMKSHKDKVASHQAAQRERQSATQEREQLKKEIKRELQSEQHPTMKPNEYNKQIARQSARWKGMQIRQAHGEMEHEAGAEVAAKKARLKAIMSRESVESVDENVSSGSARRARFGVKQRVSSAEVITNTERQNQVAKHFADHAARKKASGDEAHAAATKAGKSPIEAETARQRAHRQYERQLKKGS